MFMKNNKKSYVLTKSILHHINENIRCNCDECKWIKSLVNKYINTIELLESDNVSKNN